MSISKILFLLNSDAIRWCILKILFKKNGLKLSYFKSYKSNRFFIYCVNGIYLASESINWYISLQEFENHCTTTSINFYKPKKGDTVLDIGAGLGEEVVVYSNAVGSSGRVVAVEANPDVCKVLKNIIELNKILNVEVLNIALNPILEVVTINAEVESYLSGSLQRTEASVEGFEVEGINLSEIMKKYKIEVVDLLKVNIEGAERFLADENRFDIFENIKNIAISCHDFRYRKEGLEFFRTKELISAFFQDRGYQINSQSTGIEYVDDWIYGVRKY